MTKNVTFRASETDLTRIENLKNFYQECWPEANRCSTSEIIQYGIGMLHMIKVEHNFRWLQTEDLDKAIKDSKETLKELKEFNSTRKQNREQKIRQKQTIKNE